MSMRGFRDAAQFCDWLHKKPAGPCKLEGSFSRYDKSMSRGHAVTQQQQLRAQSLSGVNGRVRVGASAQSWRCVCGSANIGTFVCGQCQLHYNVETGLLYRAKPQRLPLWKNSIALAMFAVLCVGGIAFGIGSGTQTPPAETRVISVRQAPAQGAPAPAQLPSPAAQPVSTP